MTNAEREEKWRGELLDWRFAANGMATLMCCYCVLEIPPMLYMAKVSNKGTIDDFEAMAATAAFRRNCQDLEE